MKTIQIHDFGPTEEVLKYEEIPRPEPAEYQLLVKVEAASLNRADLGLRSGAFSTPRDQLPLIPGREFAGTVEALGDAVAGFQVGQRVVGYTGTGGYAEYAVAGESEGPARAGGNELRSGGRHYPPPFSPPGSACGLQASSSPGSSYWSQAGSSGVGRGRHSDRQASGRHRPDHHQWGGQGPTGCVSWGADVVIDYTRQEFVPEVMRATSDHGADVVLEMIGGDVYTKSLEALAPRGRLFSIGGAFGPIPDPHPSPGGRPLGHPFFHHRAPQGPAR